VILWLGNDEQHRYRLIFENAGQLVVGNQVQIGGHPVGSVDDISLTADGQAAIEISLDQELHQGSDAVIRATSLAGIASATSRSRPDSTTRLCLRAEA
jgi:phospholipid/cholesterol/gamma-HCH transport system substrate-binding protein